jgi:predicted enzyme related to lactoylglutathione lyase
MAQAEMSKHNVAVWFEIPARDFARAKRFYETVFGVRLTDERMGDHVLGVFPHAGDAVSGCVMSGPGYAPAGDGAVVYINAGADLSGALSRVEAAGGKVALPKTFLSEEIGYFAHFIDSEGNRVGMHSLH